MTISTRLPAWRAGLLLASALSAALPAAADPSASRPANAPVPGLSTAALSANAPSAAAPADAADPSFLARLSQRWAALRAAQPAISTADAARTLQVPEAQLLASAIGRDVVLLKNSQGAARDLMRAALDFGQVRTQTANDAVLLERTGVATRLEQEEGAPAPDPDGGGEGRGASFAGGYVGGAIDLRFNFDAWRYAYAVTQPGADGWPERSLQFFDAQGAAIHKLFLTNEVAAGLFEQLARDFRAPDQHPPAFTAAAPAAPPERPDSAIDVAQFRQAWLALTDAGQFGAMLAQFGVTRAQALRLAPPGMVRQIGPAMAPQALRTLLGEVARQRLAIMALVGNAGVTQMYAGPLAEAAGDGDALLAQAPGLRLRLRGGALRGGDVVLRAGAASVEFYGPDGEPAVTFFSAGGRAQAPAWAALIRGLPGLPPDRPPARP